MMVIIQWLRSKIFFKLCVIYLRYLIGVAFVFASVVKIKGQRFTSIPPSEPVGYFFEAMYQTGMYWNFLGWSQLVAGILLMTQRFSTVGAFIFLPIITNVWLITLSVDFGSGTPVITSLMFLGTVFLVLWDYPKWKHFFQREHTIQLDLTHQPPDVWMNHRGWEWGGIFFVTVTLAVQFLPQSFASMMVWAILMIFGGCTTSLVVFVKNKNLMQKAKTDI
jgi:hypothetical protein